MSDSLVVMEDDPALKLAPEPIGRSGKIGGSTYYRKGRVSAIGRKSRRGKERAAINQRKRQFAMQSESWCKRRMQRFEARCAFYRRRYGDCGQCGNIIIPKSLKHRLFLDGCLERGKRCDHCYECNSARCRRVGLAKFAILKRRGKNPRIVGNQLVVD